MDITLELSHDKYPPASTLPSHWSDNRDSLLALPITAVLGGVSGQVTDTTGAPIRGATITIDGISMKSSARGPLAYYNRPLAPGSYTIRVQAPGYRPTSATVAVPRNGQGVVQNFTLAQSRQAGALAGTAVEPVYEVMQG